MLHPADAVKSDYILARRFVAGDRAAGVALFSSSNGYEVRFRAFWDRLLPWEKYRELRALNLATKRSLEALGDFEAMLRNGEGVGYLLQEPRYRQEFPPFPTYAEIEYLRHEMTVEMARFEAHRRAARLMLAIADWEIAHGELPPSLDVLVDGHFRRLPHDPYSGLDFLYFPAGMPEPQTRLEAVDLERSGIAIVPGKPCLWCTGPGLKARVTTYENPDEQGSSPPESLVDYEAGNEYEPPSRLANYAAWGRGLWFPIPARRE